MPNRYTAQEIASHVERLRKIADWNDTIGIIQQLGDQFADLVATNCRMSRQIEEVAKAAGKVKDQVAALERQLALTKTDLDKYEDGRGGACTIAELEKQLAEVLEENKILSDNLRAEEDEDVRLTNTDLDKYEGVVVHGVACTIAERLVPPNSVVQSAVDEVAKWEKWQRTTNDPCGPIDRMTNTEGGRNMTTKKEEPISATVRLDNLTVDSRVPSSSLYPADGPSPDDLRLAVIKLLMDEYREVDNAPFYTSPEGVDYMVHRINEQVRDIENDLPGLTPAMIGVVSLFGYLKRLMYRAGLELNVGNDGTMTIGPVKDHWKPVRGGGQA